MVGVISRDLDEDGGPTWTVALVGQLLVDATLELSGTLLDGPIDVLARHVDRFGGVDRGAQPRVAARITAAASGRHGDLTDDLGPGRGALGIGDRLLALDLLPFAMAGHGRAPWKWRGFDRSRGVGAASGNISATPACGNAPMPLVSPVYVLIQSPIDRGLLDPACLRIGASRPQAPHTGSRVLPPTAASRAGAGLPGRRRRCPPA